jgi:NCS1 family nucleobase:cation symporter-1
VLICLQGGWNLAAVAAVVVGVLPSLPGLLASCGVTSAAPPLFRAIYDCAWFVGVVVSSVLYTVLMAGVAPAPEAAAAGAG